MKKIVTVFAVIALLMGSYMTYNQYNSLRLLEVEFHDLHKAKIEQNKLVDSQSIEIETLHTELEDFRRQEKIIEENTSSELLEKEIQETLNKAQNDLRNNAGEWIIGSDNYKPQLGTFLVNNINEYALIENFVDNKTTRISSCFSLNGLPSKITYSYNENIEELIIRCTDSSGFEYLKYYYLKNDNSWFKKVEFALSTFSNNGSTEFHSTDWIEVNENEMVSDDLKEGINNLTIELKSSINHTIVNASENEDYSMILEKYNDPKGNTYISESMIVTNFTLYMYELISVENVDDIVELRIIARSRESYVDGMQYYDVEIPITVVFDGEKLMIYEDYENAKLN